MGFDFDPHEVISHIVSGLTLAVVGYIAARVRTLLHRFRALPSRMYLAEKSLENHERRIRTLEEAPAGK